MNEDFIYLDNAATTWPKPEVVYEAVARCLRESGANPGRASHRMSVAAEWIIGETRALVAGFFGAPSPSHVIFTLNCTDALNMALKGLLRPGDKVVTGPYEHNSVMRPLRHLQTRGVSLRAVDGTQNLTVNLEQFREECRGGAKLVVVSHASNVTGRTQPIREMAEIVHESGGLFLLDAAQTAGKMEIDVRDLGVDLVVAPGHKGLLGPMGVGLLIMSRELDIEPLREGGTGVGSEEEFHPRDLPWALEAGTPNLPGIAGLGAGVKFLRSVGLKAVRAKEAELSALLVQGLERIPGVQVFQGPGGPENGIVSFTIRGCEASVAGTILDQTFAIGVRPGLHCSPDAHKALGTFPQGTIRASFGYFNQPDHVERLVSAIGQIAEESRY
ncbi:MAG: aminotransferase class V-fold PLP-dependent enzyme [Bacillota bacterium]